MKNNLSRRAALAGAATLPVLALPSLAAAMSRADDSALGAKLTELRTLALRIEVDGHAADALERAARASLPPVPPELLRPIEMLPLDEGQSLTMATSSGAPSNEWRGWTQLELQPMLDSGTYSFAARFDTEHVKSMLNCDMAITCKDVRMSSETKSEIARLLGLARERDEREAIAFAPHVAAQEAWEGLLDAEDDLLAEIAAWPVASLRGLAMKAAALAESNRFTDSYLDEFQRNAFTALFESIAALAKSA